jgi:hypothetical protein
MLLISGSDVVQQNQGQISKGEKEVKTLRKQLDTLSGNFEEERKLKEMHTERHFLQRKYIFDKNELKMQKTKTIDNIEKSWDEKDVELSNTNDKIEEEWNDWTGEFFRNEKNDDDSWEKKETEKNEKIAQIRKDWHEKLTEKFDAINKAEREYDTSWNICFKTHLISIDKVNETIAKLEMSLQFKSDIEKLYAKLTKQQTKLAELKTSKLHADVHGKLIDFFDIVLPEIKENIKKIEEKINERDEN